MYEVITGADIISRQLEIMIENMGKIQDRLSVLVSIKQLLARKKNEIESFKIGDSSSRLFSDLPVQENI